MEEPEKPFACTIPECRMTFTNEDHLHVHIKKHDMMLQLGEQKAVFVADQTPTPTRFIRNCEEVGLFQDLQNVNPFDEGFKRAMETKQGILSMENGISTSSEELHTPQMFPLVDPSNIVLSRSSSDESGAIKEFQTTTISKCTNEVTTISTVIEKHDDLQNDEKNHIKNNSVYTNNVIKIKSNVEIRKSDADNTNFDTMPPLLSQKSIDYVVDSLTADFEKKNDYEVLLKLPSGKQIKLTSAEEVKEKRNPKEILKKVLQEKVDVKTLPVIIPNITSGTLIPVSIVNPSVVLKPPSVVLKNPSVVTKNISDVPKTKIFDKKPVKRKTEDDKDGKVSKSVLDSRCAASRRYRARLKETMSKQTLENKQLKEMNQKLLNENNLLKHIIMEHIKKCPDSNDLKFKEISKET